MVLTLNAGTTTITMPNPMFGNTDQSESAFVIGRRSTNQELRYVSHLWRTTVTYNISFRVPKCHPTFSTKDEVVSFFETNNGKPINYDFLNQNGSAIILVNDVKEYLSYWIFDCALVALEGD